MRRVARLAVVIGASVGLPMLALCPVAHAGPITFPAALPVPAGQVLVREQLVWTHAGRGPRPERARVNVLSIPTLVGVGLHRQVVLFAVLPFVYKNAAVDLPTGGRTTRTARGFGDLDLFARFTLVQRDGPGRTLRFAPLLGLTMPTGSTRENDDFGRLPADLQVGGGAWSPRLGGVLTWQTLDFELDVALEGILRAPDNELDRGDEVRGSASFQLRVFPRGELGGGVPTFLYLVAETQAGWVMRDKGSLASIQSGGPYWRVTPGIQIVAMRWVVEAAAEIPVVQPEGGHVDVRTRVGVRGSF